MGLFSKAKKAWKKLKKEATALAADVEAAAENVADWGEAKASALARKISQKVENLQDGVALLELVKEAAKFEVCDLSRDASPIDDAICEAKAYWRAADYLSPLIWD
ncbi:DNA repair ATPase RecN [Rhodoligotrophos appendicifer]|uniref:hypothetical protein n=1 Tax=Rhodoligotrophos appendicifer TaxID=987056 RepID=UPI0011869E1B|nr:hypothetical protein [Rhodoligotrophos appendicifer]